MNQENDMQVSVCVVTYNQENYIAECLESLVTQQTNFKFEIIIGEDCSTDGTRAVVQSYVERYPSLIVPLFYKNNIGAVENIKQVYKKAKGKYIAHMDGDDIALPGKLQKQFDALELHSDCNVCTHDVYKIDGLGRNIKSSISFPEGEYSLFDLYCNFPFFAHSSKMFRNNYNVIFWDGLLNENYILDLDIHIANLIDGNIYHIGDYYGKYRVNTGISFAGGKLNPILPMGTDRVFKKGKIIFKDDLYKLDIIEKLYAKALLNCAYQYALNDKSVSKFKEYVKKSVNQKKIGGLQVVFQVGSFMPKTFIKLLVWYKKIRDLNLI